MKRKRESDHQSTKLQEVLHSNLIVNLTYHLFRCFQVSLAGGHSMWSEGQYEESVNMLG